MPCSGAFKKLEYFFLVVKVWTHRRQGCRTHLGDIRLGKETLREAGAWSCEPLLSDFVGFCWILTQFWSHSVRWRPRPRPGPGPGLALDKAGSILGACTAVSALCTAVCVLVLVRTSQLQNQIDPGPGPEPGAGLPQTDGPKAGLHP